MDFLDDLSDLIDEGRRRAAVAAAQLAVEIAPTVSELGRVGDVLDDVVALPGRAADALGLGELADDLGRRTSAAASRLDGPAVLRPIELQLDVARGIGSDLIDGAVEASIDGFGLRGPIDEIRRRSANAFLDVVRTGQLHELSPFELQVEVGSRVLQGVAGDVAEVAGQTAAAAGRGLARGLGPIGLVLLVGGVALVVFLVVKL